MKTAEEILKETISKAEHDSSYDMTIDAMKEYALQVAEAARRACIAEFNKSGNDFEVAALDLTQYIK